MSTFNAISGKPLQSALLLGGGKTHPSGLRWTLIGAGFGCAYGYLFGGWLWLLIFGALGAVVGPFLQPIFRGFNRLFDALSQAYARLLQTAIRLRRLLVSAVLGGVVLFHQRAAHRPPGVDRRDDAAQQALFVGVVALERADEALRRTFFSRMRVLFSRRNRHQTDAPIEIRNSPTYTENCESPGWWWNVIIVPSLRVVWTASYGQLYLRAAVCGGCQEAIG